MNRDQRSVRIDRIIASKAAGIARAEGRPISEVLNEILEKPIDARYARLLREIEQGDE